MTEPMDREYDPCKESERLRAQNDAALQSIANANPQIRVEAASLLGVRLAALLDHTLGPLYIERDGRTVPNWARGQFELELQRNYATMIADMQGQIARAKLLEGVRLQN